MSNLNAAMKLYQENGDSTSSLRECQKVWKSQTAPTPAATAAAASSTEKSAANNSSNEEENGAVSSSSTQQQMPLSRQHNEAILQNLAAQRQRSRRVRPRPSSFDAGDDHNNNKEGGGDLNSKKSDDNDEKPQSSTDNGGGDIMITALKDILAKLSVQQQHRSTPPQTHDDSSLGNNNDQVQELIASYNLSLAHYAQGDYKTALQGLGGVLLTWMEALRIYNNNNGGKKEAVTVLIQNKDDSSGIHLPVDSENVASILSILTRATFLYLDCSFTVYVGNGRGMMMEEMILLHGKDEDEGGSSEEVKSVNVQDVLKWVESTILVYAREQTKSVVGEEGMGLHHDDVVTVDEVKFKLHLYKSRLLLQGTCEVEVTKDVETRARLARKELKNAMDIYQNKLCVLMEDESGSECRGGAGGASNYNEKETIEGEGGGGRHKQRVEKGSSNNNHQQDTSETTSISGSLVTSASDGLWKEGKDGVVARATFEGMPNNKHPQQQSQPQVAAAGVAPTAPEAVKVKKDSPGLHVRHEAVLYTKANLEYMRGNTTKSLKLCAEARTAGKKSRARSHGVSTEENGFAHNDAAVANGNGNDTSTVEEDAETQMANDYDEAIYYNNLAMVHQSAGKIHVALHYYSYAISYMENVQFPNDNFFWSDGVPRPNVTADILNNASLCAFQAHDYKRAYECMAHCVTLSPSIFGVRARCWLRMAQSLIGIHVNQQQPPSSNDSDALTNDMSLLECNLGGEDDLRSISTNPLPRIIACLEHAQELISGRREGENQEDRDMECFEAATLALAYAKLEVKDAAGALEMCKVILLGGDNIAAIANEDRSDYSSESLRRRAMARLYACEAFCRLGDPNSALLIVESESSLQSIASDISASHSTHHHAYAQFATRATASGTFSSTGSFDRSKAQASMTTKVAETLSDRARGNIDNVFEKRAHLFSRLKEGDTDGAIAILRSGLGRV